MLALASLVVLIDEVLKWTALERNWEIHRNYGIAFDLPLRIPFVIGLSLLIGFLLLAVVLRERKRHPPMALAASLILIGGAGNLFDRLAYGFTVDYLILFWRSAINLSDLVILSGMASMLFAGRKLPQPTIDPVRNPPGKISTH
jgi:signal peptidase II